MKLQQALQGIAATIRGNEQALRQATDTHSAQIDAVAGNL